MKKKMFGYKTIWLNTQLSHHFFSDLFHKLKTKRINDYLKNNSVCQKFCNILVMWGPIQMLLKVTNHIWLWDTKLAWYSQSVTCWICFYDLKHVLRIHCFRLTWLCLIVEFLATWAKFLQLSAYCTLVNYALSFHTVDVWAQFIFVKHKFPI